MKNAMAEFYPLLVAAADHVATTASITSPVPFRLPEFDSRMRDFLGASDISLSEAGTWRGHHLSLLDLMRNPGTRTCKTFASLTLIARAVRHIQETGAKVMIITPTSGNKGTALRDAVSRAYAANLASVENLRVVTVVPRSSRDKLRNGPLSTDPSWRAANPVLLMDVHRPDGVKAIARAAFEHLRADAASLAGFTPWFTLDLDNYRVADTLRAAVEARLDPIVADSPPRVHAHAVSSAFGLLGYHLGHGMLNSGSFGSHLPVPFSHPGFLLVQQLATPDMVLSLIHGDVSRDHLPQYAFDEADGLWRQAGKEVDPHFPTLIDDVDERLDSTFYTSAPPTSPAINGLIAQHGGGGIVVSRRECLLRYEDIQECIAATGNTLPDDPGTIREWSLVKAFTGVMMAIERGLIKPGTAVVVHGSGFYTDAILPPLSSEPSVIADSAVAIEYAMTQAAKVVG
ncbi:DUF6002 family protein [Streptomyces sp. NPDC006996]|uniref:DUF6002 family protein n=1 Tax=Streptomyces sp. NPDC006996 TaxID=3156908 RepID=UPI0033FA9FE6